METVNVTLRIDKQTKQNADQLFASLGLNFSTAVNAFLQKAIRTRSIPFELSEKTDDSTKTLETELLVDQIARILTSDDARRRISRIHEGVVPETNGLKSIEDAKRILGMTD